MGNIVLLDEHTVNKIAAGEVVDRPASIVKELVENSIDAKATDITIEIKNGGIKNIKIIDNGTGIKADDVEMAFERHATSKIRKEEDLHKIKTMGFRGEALASVAAISKITAFTRHIDESVGTKIVVEAGKIISLEETGSKQGTLININDIFYNVPARYKFLKKDYTEAGYIEDVVLRLAMVNPNIAFTYINNGKKVLSTTGTTDQKTVIFSLFGKDIYDNIEEVNYEFQGIKVTGCIGNPKISRSTRKDQYTYINNRYVKNKTITSAIDRAYEEELAINKFAFAVINIDMNPENIDVNVHPAKLEVKFDNESIVFEAIYHAIKNTLKSYNKKVSPFSEQVYTRNIAYQKDDKTVNLSNILSGIGTNEPNVNYQTFSNSFSYNNSVNQQITKDKVENKEERIEENYKNIQNETFKTDVYSKEDNISFDLTNKTKIEEIDKYSESEIKENNENIKENEYELSQTQKEESKKPEYYKYIGCIFDSYIIIQINDKMYIIDQHAAHERLLYERVKKRYYSMDKQTQMLLIPILIELKPNEKEIVEENKEMFENAGYIIEDFGDRDYKISGVPNIGYNIDYKSMFIDILDELMGATKTSKDEKEFRLLATIACKAAVKANMKLSKEEHISLIDEMMTLDRPFTCPHGRPTAYEISRYEIERRFLRK